MYGLLTSCGFALIPVSMLTYFRCKTPKFEDKFNIRDQIRLILYPGIILILFLLVNITLNEIIINKFMLDVLHMLNLFIFSTFASWVICINTLWVIYHQKGQKDEQIASSIQVPSKHEINLESVLSTNDGFEAFMNHLGEVC